MPTTLTTRLGLKKPDPVSGLVLASELNDNSDVLDNNPGVHVCTSTTHPATAWDGRFIYETDTEQLKVYRGDLSMFVPAERLRYVVDGSAFINLAASSSSRVIANMTVPQAPYIRKAYIHARVSIISGAISTGTLEEDVAVSALVGTVADAQGRSRVIFNSTNAQHYQTVQVDAYVEIPANTDPLIRAWVYNHASSAVTTQVAGGAFCLMWADLEPKR